MVNASAHQSGAKHYENLNADTHSNECLSERRISSKGSMTLAFDEIDYDDSGDVSSASLDSIDHVACGERTGHLKLVFICSKGTTKVFVTGTCRFADHARFGQLYFKIGDKRRKKVEAYVHDGGNALGISDQKKCVPYHQHDYCGRAGHNSGAAVSLVANKRDIRSGSI